MVLALDLTMPPHLTRILGLLYQVRTLHFHKFTRSSLGQLVLVFAEDHEPQCALVCIPLRLNTLLVPPNSVQQTLWFPHLSEYLSGLESWALCVDRQKHVIFMPQHHVTHNVFECMPTRQTASV